MNPFLQLLALSFIGSIAGLIGGVVLLFKKDWTKSLTTVAISLAAGVLLAVSLLNLLPEAVEQIGRLAFTIILVVFVVLFLIERFLFYLHHHEEPGGHEHEKRHTETSIPLLMFGDTIHNLLDGVAIASAYLVNPALGLLVAISTFLHETPHEIADFGILVSKGWSRKKALTVNFLSALATFPGAILTYLYATQAEGATGILLAVAAGLFLYVAATDFLPDVSHAPRDSARKQAIFFIFGILIIIVLGILVPEPQS